MSGNKPLEAFQNLNLKKFKDDIAKSFYFAVLKVKDILVEKSGVLADENSPFRTFETLEMAQSEPTERRKFTYWGKKKIVMKDIDCSYEDEGELSMKKFIALTNESKAVFMFFLGHLVNEVRHYFVHALGRDSRKLPDDTQFMIEVAKHAHKNFGAPVTPFMIRCCELTDVTAQIRGSYNGIINHLNAKMKPYLYESGEGGMPETKIVRVFESYVNFLHFLAIQTAWRQFKNKSAFNLSFLVSVIVSANALLMDKSYVNSLRDTDALSFEALDNLQNFITLTAPKKKGEDEDGETKPAKSKGASANSRRGRPSAKVKPGDSPSADESMLASGEVDSTVSDLKWDE